MPELPGRRKLRLQVVRALRAAGYDVFAVSDVASRSDDRELIAQAAQEQRVLLTEDKDLGWIVFVSQEESAGVILIRYPGHARQELANAVTSLVQNYGTRLSGTSVVLQPGYTRTRGRPQS